MLSHGMKMVRRFSLSLEFLRGEASLRNGDSAKQRSPALISEYGGSPNAVIASTLE